MDKKSLWSMMTWHCCMWNFKTYFSVVWNKTERSRSPLARYPIFVQRCAMGWQTNSARLAIQDLHPNARNVVLPSKRGRLWQLFFPHLSLPLLQYCNKAENTWSMFCLWLVVVRDLIMIAGCHWYKELAGKEQLMKQDFYKELADLLISSDSLWRKQSLLIRFRAF